MRSDWGDAITWKPSCVNSACQNGYSSYMFSPIGMPMRPRRRSPGSSARSMRRFSAYRFGSGALPPPVMRSQRLPETNRRSFSPAAPGKRITVSWQ